MKKKDYKLHKLLISISIVFSLICPYGPFSHITYAEPIVITPDLDDITDVVTALLPVVVSNSNATSLTKYSPWRNKVRSAIQTLIAEGYITLAVMANVLATNVNKVGATITFGSSAWTIINSIWNKVKNENNISNGTNGIIEVGTESNLPDNIGYLIPHYFILMFQSYSGNSSIGYVSLHGASAQVTAIKPNFYDVEIPQTIWNTYDNLVNTAGFITDVYYGYTGSNSLKVNTTVNCSVRPKSSSYGIDDLATYSWPDGWGVSILHSTNETYFNNEMAILDVTSDDISSAVSIQLQGSGYGRMNRDDLSSSNNYTYTIPANQYYIIRVGTNYGWLDKSDIYNRNTNTQTNTYYYMFNGYSNQLSTWNGTQNTLTSYSNQNMLPLTVDFPPLNTKPAIYFNDTSYNAGGDYESGNYTVGYPEAPIYSNDMYENVVTVPNTANYDWDELLQYLENSYNNGTDNLNVTRDLYDIQTQQLVNVQNIDSTTYNILDILQNGNSITGSAVNNSSSVNSQFSENANSLYTYENNFANNFSDSIEDLIMENPSNWGRDFLQSSNWVKEQYDRMTVNTQIGKLLGFSMALGFVLLIIGRILK